MYIYILYMYIYKYTIRPIYISNIKPIKSYNPRVYYRFCRPFSLFVYVNF